MSAFYFGHRKSEDIDLFASNPITDICSVMGRLSLEIKRTIGASVIIMSGGSDDFASCSVVDGNLSVKIDLVYDPFAAEGEKHLLDFDGVIVRIDALENLAVSKFSAFLSRGDKKDCLDIARILEEAQKFDEDLREFTPWLLEEARARDCMADELSYILKICRRAETLYGTDMGVFLTALSLMEGKKGRAIKNS